MGAASFGLADLLAACGRGGTSTPSASASAGFDWASQQVTGSFSFGNWPLYIDTKKVNGVEVHPSLDLFKKDTGIEVGYHEVIQDYASFFAKIHLLLGNGQATPWDLIVMEFPKWLPLMISSDYLIPLDQGRLENFTKYAAPHYRNRSYDPGNRYSVPYMSGITGIGYDPALTGREITSVMDLFDPAFTGKVGMFGDTEDMPNFTLLGMGVEPSTSTPADWNAAAELLTKQRDDGVVRQYYGQNYVRALTTGDVALTMAWSADILQLQLSGSPQLKFVVPDEGALLWTDNLCIPILAPHPLDALTFMDFIYRPEVAAMIVGYIQNVSPVPAAQDVLRKQGSPVAESQLVFPSEDMYKQLHGYRVLTKAEEQVWNQTFEPIYQG
jgi:spermidine/putrescine transport system substrate-binding protein